MIETGRRQRRARAMLLAGAFAGGLAAAVPPAQAADVSAADAQTLEQQVHDWLAALLGPQVQLGDLPLHITAEADHYRLELPFVAPLATLGVTAEGDAVTAKLTPLEGGRWAVDDLHAPSPLHLSYAMPGDAGAGQFTATIDQQDQHAVIDPSFATPSHWDATFKGYTSTFEGGKDKGSSQMHVDELIGHISIDPAQDGRVNVTEESDTRLLASNATVPQAGVVSFTVARMHGALHLTGLAPDQIAPLVHAALTLAPLGAAAAAQAHAGTAPDTGADTGATPAPDHKAVHELAEANRKAAEADRAAADADRAAVAAGTMTPADRKKNAEARHARALARMEALRAARAQAAGAATGTPSLTADQKTAVHAALVALAELITGFDEDGTMEDVHVSAANYSGHLDKLSFGLGVGAPDGRTAIHLSFALDGLDSANVPPGIYRDYMPRHIAFAPRLGGVPASDLRDLLLRAADSDGKDPQLQADAMALLEKGPVVAGLDDLSLDFGPATLKGSGEVRISGINQYQGEAHFAATGLDALIKQANTVPELKQAGPVLFLLKGMGRQDGANTVWDVTYRDSKVLVNGNDLAGMLGGK